MKICPGWDILIGIRVIISRIAVWLLVGASVAGWLFSGLIPEDFLYRRSYYSSRWGEGLVDLVEYLNLYQPFRSSWYHTAFLFLTVTALLCLLARVTDISREKNRPDPGQMLRRLGRGNPRVDISWGQILVRHQGDDDLLSRVQRAYPPEIRLEGRRLEEIFAELRKILKDRSYRITSVVRDEGIMFVSRAGGLRRWGGIVLHSGLIILAIGGILGTLRGSAELNYGREGECLRMRNGHRYILVEDVEIFRSPELKVEEIASSIAVLSSSGDTLSRGKVEINHPVSSGKYRIYQNSFYMDRRRFRWADIALVDVEGDSVREFRIKPSGEVALEGEIFLRPVRFFPGFRMTPEGPRSDGLDANNPALEIEIVGREGRESGWLFLFHPRYDSEFSIAPLRFRLTGIEPVFYSGLEVRRNPGGKTVIAGMIITLAGLVIMFCSRYGVLGGYIHGRGLTLAGLEYDLGFKFNSEFGEMTDALQERLSGIIPGPGEDY